MAQIIEAIYEDGVLKPIKPINVKEHTRVRLIMEVDEERKKKADEILALARESFEGLTAEEISVIESARINNISFLKDVNQNEK